MPGVVHVPVANDDVVFVSLARGHKTFLECILELVSIASRGEIGRLIAAFSRH